MLSHHLASKKKAHLTLQFADCKSPLAGYHRQHECGMHYLLTHYSAGECHLWSSNWSQLWFLVAHLHSRAYTLTLSYAHLASHTTHADTHADIQYTQTGTLVTNGSITGYYTSTPVLTHLSYQYYITVTYVRTYVHTSPSASYLLWFSVSSVGE